MKDFNDKVIAITGAGSGIGRELAKQLAAQNATLSLNDFSAERLAETVDLLQLPKEKISQHVFDVGNQNAMKHYIEDTISIHGQIDGIINNAGTSLGKVKVIEMEYSEVDFLFKVNLWGVIYGTKEALPYLIRRPEAFIANVSSVFGLMGVPTQSAYCMTKFAVRGFTESLRMEVARHSNLKIYQIHPGGIDTNIIENSKIRTEAEKLKLKRNFKKSAITSAAKAAEIIIDGIQKNKTRILIGRDAKLIDMATRLFPSLYHKFVMRSIRKRKI
ncbi:MAG: SDR family NAD(P)-dependent oxidoreductase [Saprospiraceae bacterium]